jgi:hypothetical protein
VCGVFIFADDTGDDVIARAALAYHILRRPSDAPLYHGKWSELFEVAENFGLGGGVRTDHPGTVA